MSPNDTAMLCQQQLPPVKQTRRVLLLPVILLLIGSASLNPEFFFILRDTVSDAYLGVSIFVAATLAGFYFLQRSLSGKLGQRLISKRILQIPAASFLGALPGCGGAIIVTTQFVNGKMSFGALVAVLISTMGDAAFILLAKKPQIALFIYGISMAAGILFGYLVDALHRDDFLRPKRDKSETKAIDIIPSELSSGAQSVFIALLLPGSILGVLGAMQIEDELIFGQFAKYDIGPWLGFFGGMLCLYIYLNQSRQYWADLFKDRQQQSVSESTVAETSLISVWVIIGFLSYELLVYFTGLDLSQHFLELGAGAILLAILIGFIPGCGPQILVTTLFVNGIVPLSAQLANAISNDGDALFPAIALAPKAALIATLYSAIPAAIIGYSAFHLGY